MILRGEKVILRYPEMSDAKWLFEHITVPEVAKGLGPQIMKLKKLSQEKKWIKSLPKSRRKKETLNFTIVDKKTKKLIGACGFNKFNFDEKFAVVGWWIAKEYWGQGYMVDAAKTLLKYGFNNLKLHRLEAEIHGDNPRSLGLAKKLGFKLEGTKREGHYHKGKFEAMWIVGLLKKEAKFL